ncbi:class I SAM-dependent DNA methyltransferase [Ferribacterium limneticum]|uniref:class I SAM-dependent DNA methyltransferase n=1 Tax=Ferribacterium limneticum TaxID=76259 RepID=UPI001CFA490A|nr:DNA methyltransferase [Ferribacterium limneticum]UCV27743.1 class I SAM-dependent DNA methyltransferase [Ferribacterium limneticum]UCV31660.1 class I SAM-dependent DNA methyltransferase [Ferribacterium limneticum]
MHIDTFLARWRAAGGSERANYQLFIADLCALLEVAPPQPANEDTRDNPYVFERRVIFHHGDGSTSNGFIDCYKRGSFIGEAKKIRAGAETRQFDDALLRARGQAENYARHLPADEGRPPFLVVLDVGNVIELYAEFTCTGGSYTPFPDPRSHRIRLDDLSKPEIRARLKAVWHDPHSLDPARRTARATREIAVRLARVAQSLEGKYQPERVAAFLSRCLFSMFAEDVGLLPKVDNEGAFTGLLKSFLLPSPASGRGAGGEGSPVSQFVPLVAELWQAMDEGKFSVAIRAQLPRFNGKLFKQPEVLPLDRDQIDLLLEASRADWAEVEPAIFGTLLESALNPLERHDLGAHYTPRAYVDRLVLPTVIEPLRANWHDTQAAALLLANEGKLKDAADLVRAWHHKLCTTRVLDPACGSGNFLYVTLEHMKRLEGEVLDTLAQLGDTQQRLEVEGLTVDPHQFLGLEINPRAAAIAEMVLWIGYLQWHFRTQGSGLPPSPILRDFKNIECRDAVLTADAIAFATDESGKPLTRWDGRTTKPHPVTGELVPDEAAQIPRERYTNPRPATWPQADYIVGNPPFIGAAAMRQALGDGYTEALRAAWPAVPESADFVMFWWHHAADLTRRGEVQRFGFITTNSLKQTFNRRVLEHHLNAQPPLALAWAIPDHPWVDAASGAAVRIAMTVATASLPSPAGGRGAGGEGSGILQTVVGEGGADGDAVHIELTEKTGRIHADLSIGADVVGAKALRANEGISSAGFKLHGAGFIVSPDEAAKLQPCDRIHPYRNGRDLTDKPRGVLVIDLYGLTANEARSRYPATYQWVLERVKPERDQNNRATYRDNWWLFGEPRKDLRPMLAGQPRFIATVETAKHRTFQFLDAAIAPDNKLVCIALADAYALGVLSSQVHVAWALAAGSRLGVGNDPVYVKTTCFEKFPFPAASPEQQARIAALAEQLDTHRKRQQAAHPELTLTGMYNVLAKLRSGEPLTAKDKAQHEAGLVAVLRQLHDELDTAVLEAYGWSDLLPSPASGREAGGEGTINTDALLDRLVALNAERSREEATGLIRWLRPEFQNPKATHPHPNPPLEGEGATLLPLYGPQGRYPLGQGGGREGDGSLPAPKPAEKRPWPPSLPEQVAAIAQLLAESPLALSEPEIASRFTGKGPWKKRLPQLLETLVALGRARMSDDGRFGASK